MIITKSLMMWPSVEALGFLVIFIKQNPGVLKPEKNFAPAALESGITHLFFNEEVASDARISV